MESCVTHPLKDQIMHLWHLTMPYCIKTCKLFVYELENTGNTVNKCDINFCMIYRNVNNRQQTKTIEWDCNLLSIIIRWNALYAMFLTDGLMIYHFFFHNTITGCLFLLLEVFANMLLGFGSKNNSKQRKQR